MIKIIASVFVQLTLNGAQTPLECREYSLGSCGVVLTDCRYVQGGGRIDGLLCFNDVIMIRDHSDQEPSR